MAQLTINTTPDQDAAAQIMFRRDLLKDPALTVAQWAKAQLVALLDRWVAQTDDETRATKAALYQRASSDDKAAIDAILVKYQ